MRSELSEQKKRIQVLEYLNSVLTDLIRNGFNLSPAVIEVSCFLSRSLAKKK